MDSAASNAVRNERSNSSSSTGSAPTSPTSPTARRASSSGLFESLHAQKRATDPTSVARRQSLHDQRPQAGFFGKMWNDFVRGTNAK